MAVGICEDCPEEVCPACEGTGFAVNCTEVDRQRGDLWTCGICDGTGFLRVEVEYFVVNGREVDLCGYHRTFYDPEPRYVLSRGLAG